MTIAVHIRFANSQADPSDNLQYNCFTILANRYPEQNFIFIFDKPYPPGIIPAKNIKILLLPPEVRNPLLQHYWYNYKIPRVLNRYNVDHFISSGPVCSLRTTISQCMILNDLSFLDKKNLYASGETRYLKKYFKKFVTKASCIAVTNQLVRNSLAGIYPDAIDKILVIGKGVSNKAMVLDYDEMQNIKEQYSGGKEYFLSFITDASIENTILLLKAFSAFKKRQLSNMQLLLLVSSAQKNDIVKDFANYKYRDDVKILIAVNKEQETAITASAYAAIYLPAINVMEEKGLLALINGVPLVATDNEFSKSLYHEAALYTVADERQLAEKLMLLYKDENLRNNLLHAGRSIATTYTWEQTAGKLAQSLLDTATQTT